MHVGRRYAGALLVAGIATACATSPAHNRIQLVYSAVATAELQHLPYPVASTAMAEFSLVEAYAVQKHVVRLTFRNDRIGGFKAGLTSQPAWERFGLSEPLAGVLPASGALTDGATVQVGDFRALKIETELAFIVAAPIVETLPDTASLRPKIAALAPAIELPDLAFTDMAALRGIDVIAANASAAQYIVGATYPVDSVDFNALTIVLFRDDKEIGKGKATDAMGDPWLAALWLVNHTIAQGYVIEPGHVLLTGALGPLYPGEPGVYRADFGALGEIRFDVTE